MKFKRKDIDKKTGVRSGIFKPNHNPFLTPKRILVSTELNYKPKVKELGINIDYPHELFLAQIKIDAKSLWMRDNDYYNSVVKQAQRYLGSDIARKTCIFKPLLGVYIRERQEDGRYKKKFKQLHTLSLQLDGEQKNRIIRSVVQMTDDADYDGIVLPYFHNIFRLNNFNENLKTAQSYALNQLTSGIEIMPILPHTDNIVDFEKALSDFQDKNQEGVICIPSASSVRYRFTHNSIKDFSLNDKSEKIGLMCIDTPRKHPSKPVSHPHYTLLQGYDIVARKIRLPFLREDGKGSNDKEVEEIRKFNYKKLSIDLFNKQFLFDMSKVDTSCQPFTKFTHKELFREADKNKLLDVVLKVMEAFDSYKEMGDCQPYIASSEFTDYLKIKASLKEAYEKDFSNKQMGLGDYFA